MPLDAPVIAVGYENNCEYIFEGGRTECSHLRLYLQQDSSLMHIPSSGTKVVGSKRAPSGFEHTVDPSNFRKTGNNTKREERADRNTTRENSCVAVVPSSTPHSLLFNGGPDYRQWNKMRRRFFEKPALAVCRGPGDLLHRVSQ